MCLRVSLWTQGRDFLASVSDRNQPLFDVGCRPGELLEMHEEARVAKLASEIRDKRLHLGVNKEVFAVGIVEHLRINRSIVYKRSGHVPIGQHHAIVTTSLAD